MLEFLLSRLTMTLCGVIVLLALAPMASSLPLGEDSDIAFDSLRELASRFDEVASCPGEIKLELKVCEYLHDGGDHFTLFKQSLWLESKRGYLAISLATAFRIYLDSARSSIEIEKGELSWGSVITLCKHPVGDGALFEAHIENLEATSDTLSPNRSTSSMVLYM